MAVSAISRLVQRESGHRRKFRGSVLIAVRRVVSLYPLLLPSHGFHRYTAAPTSRSLYVRSGALSQKRRGVISKCRKSWGHRERTPRALHPASGHLARSSELRAVRAVVCLLHLPLSTLDRDAARTRPTCPG